MEKQPSVPHLDDPALLARLQREDNAAFDLLYRRFFAGVSRFVQQNNGTAADAEDVFQEAAIALLQKLRQPDFVAPASLNAYFFTIAKNVWLKRLRTEGRRQKRQRGYVAETVRLQTDEPQAPPPMDWLQRITAQCRRLLKTVFFLEVPVDQLMRKMGWKNRHTAANQKYKCLEQARREGRKPTK